MSGHHPFSKLREKIEADPECKARDEAYARAMEDAVRLEEQRARLILSERSTPASVAVACSSAVSLGFRIRPSCAFNGSINAASAGTNTGHSEMSTRRRLSGS